MKVIFLTEGSSKTGFGHIVRCLSIYQAFELKGIKPKLIVNGDKSIEKILKNTDCILLDWLKDTDLLFKEMENTDILIIDSYLADLELYEILSTQAKLCMYIDDNRRLDYPDGVILNANIYAENLNFKKNKKHLLGTRYIPLRKEFWKIEKKEIGKNVNKIMITFGGNDIKNITPALLNFFNKNYPGIHKFVIIGNAFNNIEEIKRTSGENTILIYNADAEKMKEIMLDSDIVISAAGQTLYEICAVKTPAISIIIADNQTGNATGFHKHGVIFNAGNSEDENLINSTDFYFNKLLNQDLRKEISEKCGKLVNPKGSLAVVNQLLIFLNRKKLLN